MNKQTNIATLSSTLVQDPEGKTEGLVVAVHLGNKRRIFFLIDSDFHPRLFPFHSYFHQGSAVTWQLEHLASMCLRGEQQPKRQDNGAGGAASSAH